MKQLRITLSLALALTIAGSASLVANITGNPLNASVGSISVLETEFEAGIYVDLLSSILVTFIGVLGALIALYARRNLRGQRRLSQFDALMAASLVALGLFVGGASLPVMALGWTASGALLAALVNHRDNNRSRMASRAVAKSLAVSDLFLWTGVVASAMVLPSLDRSGLGDAVNGVRAEGLAIVALLLVVAGLVRSALVPAWRWLPQTAEAPSPVSAFLHAGIVNGAGLLVALLWPLFAAAKVALLVLLLVGSLTAVIASLAMRTRTDIKGQLASSTSAQMGYMCVQVGLGLPAVAVMHVIGHGFYKAWQFLRAGGSVTRARGELHAGSQLSPAARALLAVSAPAAGIGLALGFASGFLSEVGPVGLVPIAAGALASAAGLHAAAGLRGASFAGLAPAWLLGAVSTAGYVAMLKIWEGWMSSSLPVARLWPSSGATALTALLGSMALLTWVVFRHIRRNPYGWLGLRLLETSVPSWARTRSNRTASIDVAQSVHQPSNDQPSVEASRALVEAAGKVVSPVFPLRTFVAANPLANLEDVSFADAVHVASRSWGAHGLLAEAEYARRYAAGSISTQSMDRAVLRSGLDPRGWVPEESEPVHAHQTLCELVTDPRESRLALERASVHAGLWAAQAWGSTASTGEGPYTLWRRACAEHGFGRMSGMPLADALAIELPRDPAAAIGQLLQAMPVGVDPFGYVARIMAKEPGWSGHASWRIREGDECAVLELVALRIACDLTSARSARCGLGEPTPSAGVAGAMESIERRLVWQQAMELDYQDGLVGDLSERVIRRPVSSQPGETEAAQLVFCIDVRSERMRRQLEATGPYATFGFAGFFGAALDYVAASGQSFAQCPVLLAPQLQVFDAAGVRAWSYAQSAAVQAGKAPLAGFALAEASGLVAGAATAVQTISPGSFAKLSGSSHVSAPELSFAMGLEQRVALVEGALRAIGLTSGFAPLVVFVGHGATVQNNAFAAGYDCGACGGNSGLVNATLIADAMNDPEVRVALMERGIVIPPGTVAIAGVHDTTTDRVDLLADQLDGRAVTSVEQLRGDLRTAGGRVATERFEHLPGARGRAVQHVQARAHDWAEPSPEWGLARNAGFVAGPRWLTSGLDLEGRAFLHSYDPAADDDLGVLRTILTAPVVVAQWINSQYYFSAIDPEVFGAGDKATHNVVGDVGVLSGAVGDLRIGLPWQAVSPSEAGESWHEPLRLSVVLYASPASIDEIVRSEPKVSSLVANEWITLVSIDPASGSAKRLRTDLRWEAWGALDEMSISDEMEAAQ